MMSDLHAVLAFIAAWLTVALLIDDVFGDSQSGVATFAISFVICVVMLIVV